MENNRVDSPAGKIKRLETELAKTKTELIAKQKQLDKVNEECEKYQRSAENVELQLMEFLALGSSQEFAEMVKAKREGRLAVLSTPLMPLILDDDPMGSDVFCPVCNHDLAGAWDDLGFNEEWVLYQCPNCGQSIDSMKAVTRAEYKEKYYMEE